MAYLLKVICCFLVILISSLWVINPCVVANPYRAGQVEEVELLAGDLKVFPVEGLKRVAVGDPDVVDVSIISDKEIMLMAKSEGMTTLVIWDKAGKRSFGIKVVAEDIGKLVGQIKRLLKANGIEGVTVKVEGQKIFLVGKVVSPQDIVQIKEIIAPFPSAVNLVKIKARPPLVQINVQVLEVGRSDLRDLGIKWESESLLTGKMADITWTEPTKGKGPWLLDMWRSKSEASFTMGFGAEEVLARLRFLITEGRAHTLANPNLVTVSGGEARFVVGGEIPIVTITEEKVDIEWRTYGVVLEIRPTVMEEGEVRSNIRAEVSEIDWDNAVRGVPAMKTREASTELYLESGETIILAGLIKSEEAKNIQRLPVLSKIPILGQLFKSTKFTKGETELVISITPRIIEPGQVKEAKIREETIFKDADVTDEEHVLSEGPAEEVGWSVNPVRCKLSNGVKRFESRLDHELIYSRLLQAKISQGMIYPELARWAGWEGEVILRLCLSSDGTLEDIVVARSSGIQVLDRAAVEAVKEQAPYPRFPPEIEKKGLWVNIPIVYKLSAF